jgi:UPF0716 protein FxsA
MPVLLVLVFVGVPLLELFVILQIGGAIGGWPTAVLLITFSIVGAMLLRFEGRRAWSEFRRALSEGRWPGDEVAQGALIIVGGTLLVTPGFITDLVGFLLLLAPTRRLVARGVRKRMEGAVVIGGSAGPGRDPRRADPRRTDPRRVDPRRSAQGPRSTSDGVPLEVEVVEIRREQPPLGGSSRAAGGEPDDVDDLGVDDPTADDDGSGGGGSGRAR